MKGFVEGFFWVFGTGQLIALLFMDKDWFPRFLSLVGLVAAGAIILWVRTLPVTC